MSTTPTTNNSPIFTLRNGAFQLAIFANTTDEGKVFETVSLSRAYFDEAAQEWKYSHRFRLTQLPEVALLLQDAYAQRRHTTQEQQVEDDHVETNGDVTPNEEAQF